MAFLSTKNLGRPRTNLIPSASDRSYPIIADLSPAEQSIDMLANQ